MKLLIINGSSLMSCVYFQKDPCILNHNKEPIGTIIAFLDLMIHLQEEIQADGICICFDGSVSNFRQEMHPEYLSRSQCLTEYREEQMSPLKEILCAMNLPYYSAEGWEADDVMASIANESEKESCTVVIATGEYDAFHLITDQTAVWQFNPMTKKSQIKKMDLAVFQNQYGFPPEYLLDYKSLMGDSSDRISGIMGMRHDIVLPLIQKYHSIENIYEALKDPDETLGLESDILEKIKNGEYIARTSYELAIIRRDIPLQFSIEDTILKEKDLSSLSPALQKLEFFDIMEQLAFACMKDDSLSLCPWKEITTQDEVESFLNDCAASNWIAVETLPNLSGIAVATEKLCGICFEHAFLGYNEFLHKLFSSPIKMVVHNSKKLYQQLRLENISRDKPILDLEVASYLLSPEDKDFSLLNLLKQYKNIFMDEPCIQEELNRMTSTPNRNMAIAHLSKRVNGIRLLCDTLLGKLKQNSLFSLYHDIELPLVKILDEMESHGILVDKQALESYGEELMEEIRKLEDKIHTLAGEKFNLNSSQQLAHILFEVFELPAEKKTKKGYSTNAQVLKKLQEEHPNVEILNCIIKYKLLSKLHTTYIIGLAKHLDMDNRIRTTFQNTATATGRLSSTEPNLQNIPIRTIEGAKFREMFVAKKENVIIAADYSQMELRILAHLAEDEKMIRNFVNSEDIHSQTASQIYRVNLNEVTKEMRRSAKTMNFGIIYGMSAFSLARESGITTAEAENFIKRYFESYPQIQKYFEAVKKDGKKNGYVRTIFGRKRWLPDLKSGNFSKRMQAERIAQNTPIQGSSADIVKLAMVAVSNKLKEVSPESKLLLQIHDELLIECSELEAPTVSLLVKKEMEQVVELKVPLLVDVRFGSTW